MRRDRDSFQQVPDPINYRLNPVLKRARDDAAPKMRTVYPCELDVGGMGEALRAASDTSALILSLDPWAECPSFNWHRH